MREIENANVLHKSDNDYNKDVVYSVKTARRARNPRDYIDVLSGTKNWTEIEERTEWEMANNNYIPANSNKKLEDTIDTNTNLVVEEVIEEEER